LDLNLKILFKIKTIWVVIFTREGVYGKDGVNTGYPEDKQGDDRAKRKCYKKFALCIAL